MMGFVFLRREGRKEGICGFDLEMGVLRFAGSKMCGKEAFSAMFCFVASQSDEWMRGRIGWPSLCVLMDSIHIHTRI